MEQAKLAELDREAYISLATFRRTGVAVWTPVWFALAEDRLYVFTEGKAGKVKRLRNDSKILVAPCDVRGKIHGEESKGHGSILEPASEARAYSALLKKYGWRMRLLNLFSTLAGRIGNRAVIEIELD